MKVKQLIALLQAQDPEKLVLLGEDFEGWYYDVGGISIADGRIVEGQLTEEEDPNPPVLISFG